MKEWKRGWKVDDRGLYTRYPSSALFPFLFWGLLMNIRKKGTIVIMMGLLGNLAQGLPKASMFQHFRNTNVVAGKCGSSGVHKAILATPTPPKRVQ